MVTRLIARHLISQFVTRPKRQAQLVCITVSWKRVFWESKKTPIPQARRSNTFRTLFAWTNYSSVTEWRPPTAGVTLILRPLYVHNTVRGKPALVAITITWAKSDQYPKKYLPVAPRYSQSCDMRVNIDSAARWAIISFLRQVILVGTFFATLDCNSRAVAGHFPSSQAVRVHEGTPVYYWQKFKTDSCNEQQECSTVLYATGSEWLA